MKKIVIALLMALALLPACMNNQQETKNEDVIKKDSVTTQTGDKSQKIAVKSVILQLNSTAMGMKQKMTMYIENYGEMQYTEVTQSMLGKTVKQCSLKINDTLYSYSRLKMKGTKTPITDDSPDNINFNDLTREMADRFHLKKDGTAEILGKTCDVYQMEMPKEHIKGTYYIWKGIPMKVTTSIAGMTVAMEAEKIEENAVIDPKLFEIPADIEFELAKAR
jgi:hypothetical protein